MSEKGFSELLVEALGDGPAPAPGLPPGDIGTEPICPWCELPVLEVGVAVIGRVMHEDCADLFDSEYAAAIGG